MGNVAGYPGVFQGNPHLYPSKPVPASTGVGFMGMGGGFACLDPWTGWSLHTRLVDVGCRRGIVGVGVLRWGHQDWSTGDEVGVVDTALSRWGH